MKRRLEYSATAAWILGLTLVTGALRGAETEADFVREHYSKFEYRIPMRDGVKLFTAVYLPNDRSERYPILLRRTPYGVPPYGADAYRTALMHNEALVRDGFIFALQDVRGKFLSEGSYVNMRPHRADKQKKSDVDESTDTYDTIEWLVQNLSNHNGRVGMWGISYPGFYVSAGIIDSHPALKAASPQAPIADWFWDDMHHHGAFSLNLAFNFFSRFGVARPEPTTEGAPRFDHGMPDGYEFFLQLGPLKNANARYFHGEIDFWNQMAAHPDYDAFWQARNILPHLKNIRCAVMVVGGWYDAEDLYGPLRTYRAIEAANPGIANSLVMGPWRHGGWARGSGESLADARFGFATSLDYQARMELPFFRHHLKEEGELQLPEAMVFETGANRWREFDAWPPRACKPAKLYLSEGGGLGWEAPAGGNRADAFTSDPARPVPYVNEITTGWSTNYMAADQRFAARRPDVLVYRGETLDEDITLAGPIEVELWVSTSAGDADWVVKVIDEFPPSHMREEEGEEVDVGGMQLMVRSEIFRGRFRNGYDKPAPFTPGEPTRVRFALQDVLHTFQRGHRMAVQVQSSLFPFFDRNPQKYVENIFAAEPEDFVPATHKIYRSKAHPSHLEVGVLP